MGEPGRLLGADDGRRRRIAASSREPSMIERMIDPVGAGPEMYSEMATQSPSSIDSNQTRTPPAGSSTCASVVAPPALKRESARPC